MHLVAASVMLNNWSASIPVWVWLGHSVGISQVGLLQTPWGPIYGGAHKSHVMDKSPTLIAGSFMQNPGANTIMNGHDLYEFFVLSQYGWGSFNLCHSYSRDRWKMSERISDFKIYTLSAVLKNLDKSHCTLIYWCCRMLLRFLYPHKPWPLHALLYCIMLVTH